MTKPTVSVTARVEDCYGKAAADLQSGVTVNTDSVAGTLHHVDGYTGFNGSEPSEQSGNFLALDFSATPRIHRSPSNSSADPKDPCD